MEADALRGDDWPPSSARFAAMCRGVNPADDDYRNAPLSARPGAQMYEPWQRKGRQIESDASQRTARRELDALAKRLGVTL
jgi:hypothetical protein